MEVSPVFIAGGTFQTKTFSVFLNAKAINDQTSLIRSQTCSYHSPSLHFR